MSFTLDVLASSSYYLEGHVYTSAYARSPVEANPIPEPTTVLLLGATLLGIAGLGRERFLKRS